VEPPVHVSTGVARALARGQPVVALESSVFAQGLPAPANKLAATRMLSAVKEAGAVPAVTAVLGGVAIVGTTKRQLDSLLAGKGMSKASARDLAPAIAKRSSAATTVAGAITLAHLAGIDVFATGGIGGVHHGDGSDESADLLELSRTPLIVVCSGAKAILNLEATAERLETLGVTVVGYQTERMPAFYTLDTNIPVTLSVRTPAEVARLLVAHRRLRRPGALLVVQPVPAAAALPEAAVRRAVERALRAARADGVRGASVTPYLLSAVEKGTGGRSLGANLALLEQNARLAGAIAAACAVARNNR
jgi:pseudouridylate synthase